MAATLAEPSAVPFHLGLTEPIAETAIDDYPGVEGAYDPVEQVWKLPNGTPVTDPKASPNAFFACETYCHFDGTLIIDDVHAE